MKGSVSCCKGTQHSTKWVITAAGVSGHKALMNCPLACAEACFIIDVLRNGYTVPPGRLPGHLEGLPGFLQGLPILLWRCLPCWHLACITHKPKAALCMPVISHTAKQCISSGFAFWGERGFPCKYLYKWKMALGQE